MHDNLAGLLQSGHLEDQEGCEIIIILKWEIVCKNVNCNDLAKYLVYSLNSVL